MIHMLNNLPKDYNVVLDGLENHLIGTGDNALTVLNHWYERINKREEKVEKEKAS